MSDKKITSLGQVLAAFTITALLTGCQSVPDEQANDVVDAAPSEAEQSVKPNTSQKKAITKTKDKDKDKGTATKSVQEKPVTDLWEKTRQGLGLNLDNDHPRVMTELRWYKNKQAYFNRVTERAKPYYYFIIQEAEKRNMPLELALLPVVESAFDPFAFSHAGASGLWQFMPATAKGFGLKQNWWYDGRRDVIAGSRGALDYLVNLHGRFGDWELALAAFNSGPGRVRRAVQKNRKLGKPTHFWALDLPTETTAYVPKMIALGKVVRNPAKYGIKLKPIPNKPHFDVVDTGGQIDMARAAKLAQMPLDELYHLNPGINRWSTPPSGPHYLVVPINKAPTLEKKLAELPTEKRMQWQRYTVRPGDSLLEISNGFNTRVSLIKEVNKLSSSMIRVGQKLLIPIPAEDREEYTLTLSQRTKARLDREVKGRHRVNYEVKSGDSFWSIANEYKVGVQELARWNSLSPRGSLNVGQKLVVWSKRNHIEYQVKPGDSLSTIAHKHNVTTKNLTLWNNLSAETPLQVNQRLIVRSDTPNLHQHIKAVDALWVDRKKNTRKLHYTVRKGDSLSRIANKFNLDVNQIERWNSFDSKYLHPGQMLTLYVDVTRLHD